MPRIGRLNVPGGLFHVIGRGLEKRQIFANHQDKNNFLARVAKGITDYGHPCYAWTLMDNHYHFLLRQGESSLSTMMGPVLGGYAQYFNKKHQRSGYLFQGRFKSILCEDNAYLLELIRYIHLNPLRGGIVADINQLAGYQWSGHHMLMAGKQSEWFKTDLVLSLFGDTYKKGLERYFQFIGSACTSNNELYDFEGGGLLRSNNGGMAPFSVSADRHRRLSDERVLGGEDFVSQVLRDHNKCLQERNNRGDGLELLTQKVCRHFSINASNLQSRSRDNNISRARAVFCYWGITQFGLTTMDMARYLNISHQAVSKAAKRGRLVGTLAT